MHEVRLGYLHSILTVLLGYIICVLLLLPLKLVFTIWPKYYSLVDNKMVNTKMGDKIMSSNGNREATIAVSVMISLRANADECWKNSAWLKIEFLELLVIFPDFKDFLFLLLPLESTTCLWHPPVNSNVHHSPPVLTTQLQQYFANPAISEEWEWIMFYLEALTPTAWFQCLPLTSGIHHSALAPTTQLWCPPLGFSTHDSAPALTTCLRHSPLVSSAHHSSPAPTTQLSNICNPSKAVKVIVFDSSSTQYLPLALSSWLQCPAHGFDTHHWALILTTGLQCSLILAPTHCLQCW